MKDGAAITCPFCQGASFAGVVTYTEPPECEVRFAVTEGQTYHRELIRCERCGHFLSIHGMDMGDLYAGGYVDANYGDDALRANFERIINLPVERSDNRGRVKLPISRLQTLQTPGHRAQRGNGESSHLFERGVEHVQHSEGAPVGVGPGKNKGDHRQLKSHKQGKSACPYQHEDDEGQ